MRLEQAILDRLEKRNGQIAQLQSTVHALERAADVEREHARQEQERLRDARQRLDDLKLELREEAGKRWNATEERDALVRENTKLGARIERMEESAASAELLRKSLNAEITKRDHELRAHEKELAEQREEIRKLRAEVPLDSARDVLMNAVANMHELTKEKDRMRLQLENARADLKQALVERDSLGTMAADRALEIRKLMDGHAEDMKAQAELQSKYESILTKTTDLGSYAMTIGRKEGEPLEMFMERQALRLAALEAAITAAKCDELAKATARIKPLEALYKTLKGYQDSDSIIGNGTIIEVAIDKATEALSQLTA